MIHDRAAEGEYSGGADCGSPESYGVSSASLSSKAFYPAFREVFRFAHFSNKLGWTEISAAYTKSRIHTDGKVICPMRVKEMFKNADIAAVYQKSSSVRCSKLTSNIRRSFDRERSDSRTCAGKALRVRLYTRKYHCEENRCAH